MNLHAVVSGAINSVNPFVTGTIQVSTGYSTDAVGRQTPSYTIVTAPMQVQALGYRDLQQIDGLNLQGVRRKIYINGRLDGVVRWLAKGGDLITLSEGPETGVWKIAMVLEQYPDWCSVAVTLQDGQ